MFVSNHRTAMTLFRETVWLRFIQLFWACTKLVLNLLRYPHSSGITVARVNTQRELRGGETRTILQKRRGMWWFAKPRFSQQDRGDKYWEWMCRDSRDVVRSLSCMLNKFVSYHGIHRQVDTFDSAKFESAPRKATHLDSLRSLARVWWTLPRVPYSFSRQLGKIPRFGAVENEPRFLAVKCVNES